MNTTPKPNATKNNSGDEVGPLPPLVELGDADADALVCEATAVADMAKFNDRVDVALVVVWVPPRFRRWSSWAAY